MCGELQSYALSTNGCAPKSRQRMLSNSLKHLFAPRTLRAELDGGDGPLLIEQGRATTEYNPTTQREVQSLHCRQRVVFLVMEDACIEHLVSLVGQEISRLDMMNR